MPVPTLSVRRAWKRNGKGEFAMEQHGRFYLGKPKTRESRRRITLAPMVVAALRRAVEGRSSEDLVFGAPRGGRLDQGNWYESRWQRAIKAAQEKGLTKTPRYHDLRHTNAAWLISAGVPLPVIQKRLGHKSIQITVDVYGGLLFQTHEIADLAIERALGGKKILVSTGGALVQAEAAQRDVLHDRGLACLEDLPLSSVVDLAHRACWPAAAIAAAWETETPGAAWAWLRAEGGATSA